MEGKTKRKDETNLKIKNKSNIKNLTSNFNNVTESKSSTINDRSKGVGRQDEKSGCSSGKLGNGGFVLENRKKNK